MSIHEAWAGKWSAPSDILPDVAPVSIRLMILSNSSADINAKQGCGTDIYIDVRSVIVPIIGIV